MKSPHLPINEASKSRSVAQSQAQAVQRVSAPGVYKTVLPPAIPTTQRWGARGPNEKFADSSFQDTTKKKTKIYMLYDSSTPGEEVDYIGKSMQRDGKRFQQHKRSKALGPAIKEEILEEKDWTPFETATHEQYWIGEAGGTAVLDNRINALTTEKWDWFKTPTGHAINADQEGSLTAGHF